MNVSVANFVGDNLLAKLRREGERLAKKGDRFFLVRQLEYFRLRYSECKCEPAHSCSGCEVSFEIGTALGALTQDQREQHDVHGSANHDQRARDLWLGIRAVEGSERATIEKRWADIEEKRREKAAKRAARDAPKPPELPLGEKP